MVVTAVSTAGSCLSEFWFQSFQNWQSEVPGRLLDRGAVNLPAPARVSRVQARCCCARRDRECLSQS